jgi:hypothetical protein
VEAIKTRLILKSVKYSLTNNVYFYFDYIQSIGLRRLGGVVVSVLATGPKGCGFKPGQVDGFLSAIKIHSM